MSVSITILGYVRNVRNTASGSSWKRSRRPCCANISVAIIAIGEKRRPPSPVPVPPQPLEGFRALRPGAQPSPLPVRDQLGNASLNRRNELKFQDVRERDTSVCERVYIILTAQYCVTHNQGCQPSVFEDKIFIVLLSRCFQKCAIKMSVFQKKNQSKNLLKIPEGFAYGSQNCLYL